VVPAKLGGESQGNELSTKNTNKDSLLQIHQGLGEGLADLAEELGGTRN
jgi:hypothetical protein